MNSFFGLWSEKIYADDGIIEIIETMIASNSNKSLKIHLKTMLLMRRGVEMKPHFVFYFRCDKNKVEVVTKSVDKRQLQLGKLQLNTIKSLNKVFRLFLNFLYDFRDRFYNRRKFSSEINIFVCMCDIHRGRREITLEG